MAQVKTLLTRFKDTNTKKEYTVTITDDGYFRLMNGKPEDENPNPIADIHDDGSVKFYGAVSFADGDSHGGVSASGEDWIKFEDGTMIEWGRVPDNLVGYNSITVTHGQPYIDADYSVASTTSGSAYEYTTTGFKSKSSMSLASDFYSYISIGKWK